MEQPKEKLQVLSQAVAVKRKEKRIRKEKKLMTEKKMQTVAAPTLAPVVDPDKGKKLRHRMSVSMSGECPVPC